MPTIVTSVPRAAFVKFTERLRDEVSIPLIASNRINTPEVAEEILERGRVDAVSMARPMLADPDLPNKGQSRSRGRSIRALPANQACLDHAFVGKKVSCLLNPRAAEDHADARPYRRAKRIAVIGAGPAGLSAAVSAAQRGHRVDLFEAGSAIGGQFSIAARIPGNEEFRDSPLLHAATRGAGVTVHLGKRVTADDHRAAFRSRRHRHRSDSAAPRHSGIDHPMVMSYADAVLGHP